MIEKDGEKHVGPLRRDSLIMYIYTLEYHACVIKNSGKQIILKWQDFQGILLNEKSRHRRRVYRVYYHLKMCVYQFCLHLHKKFFGIESKK